MFSPAVDEKFEFEGRAYTFPAARPGVSYPIEIEGGRATVIRTLRMDDQSYWALKQFKPRYRTEKQLETVKRLEKVSHVPGLLAAHQSVIRPDSPLAQRESDLQWAVLMPWVAGDTWGKMLGAVQQRQRTYARHEVEVLAVQILKVLTDLERRQIVHCDLSGGNVLIKSQGGASFDFQLVDLEDMLIEGNEPASSTPGSKGYALPAVKTTACAEGDRYAGAILIAEVLALALPFDERLLSSEGVFRGNRDNQDAQARFTYVCNELKLWKPRFTALLERAWNAGSLRDCAPLADLLESLTASAVVIPSMPVAPPTSGGRFGSGATNVPLSGAAVKVEPKVPPMPTAPPPTTATPPTFSVPPIPTTPTSPAASTLPPVQQRGFGQSPVQTQLPVSPQSAPGAMQSVVLYDAETTGIATFLGGPLAGGIIMAMNYARQRKATSALLSVGLGFVALILLGALGMVIPSGLSIPLNIGSAFAAMGVARAAQGTMLADHLQMGGKKGSRWAGAGIGLLCGVILGVLIIALTGAPHK